MSSAPQVGMAREEARRKLHEKIEVHERNEKIIEFHRMTPFKIPTLIAAAGSGMTCAGRNSLKRYLLATGFSGVEVETSRESQILYSSIEKKPILSRSIMQLPVKVPGRDQLVFLEVPVLDEDDRQRDFPIKLKESILPSAVDRTLYPTVIVPKAAQVYDLFPFPAAEDCYDEKQTVSFSKANGDPLLPKDQLEQELARGIVCVLLTWEEKTLRGTTNKGFIPKELHRNSDSATDDQVDTLTIFDIDIQSWRLCKYSSIIQMRVRFHHYHTFPGTVANNEEYLKILNEIEWEKVKAALGPQPRFLRPLPN